MASVFILAGEASGDRIGAGLMEGLRRHRPALRVSGVGGEAMQAQGLKSLFAIDDLAVMGYRDVIGRLPLLLWRARQVVHEVLRTAPDLVILIDAQVFSKVVAQRLRKRGYRGQIILYVAPAVWAWGPERAPKLAQIFDEVLSVLPFEPATMEALGGPRTAYVGHPATLRYGMRHESPASGPLLLLPGSRTGEIKRHLPLLRDTAVQYADHPAVSGIAIMSTQSQAERLRTLTRAWPIKVSVVADDIQRKALMENAVAAVAVSGTITLELALAGVPHVLTYIAEGAQVALFKKATTKFIGLPNIIAGKKVIPEILFAHRGDAGQLTEALERLLVDPSARQDQVEDFREIRTLMEKGTPEAPLQDPVQTILARLPA